jgi:hypothetical protein
MAPVAAFAERRDGSRRRLRGGCQNPVKPTRFAVDPMTRR